MTIKEFIKQTVSDYDNTLRSMPASEVLLQRTTGIDWVKVFTRQRFIPITMPNHSVSNDMFEWCSDTFGEDNFIAFYTSTKRTYTFWFDKPQNATLFILKWKTQ